MRLIIFINLLLAAICGDARAALDSTNAAVADRILTIETSSMPVPAGKATLIIGPLLRTNGVYAGDYQLKVFPYFYKNEKGRLAINVSDEAIVQAGQGKVVAITGTATASGAGGRCLLIAATATPADINHGTLKLWFTADERKMVFEPAYHLVENRTPAAMAQATNIKP